MKRIKRLTTLVLTVIFTFALSVNVFAATVADGDYPISVDMAGGTHGRKVTSATLHVNGGAMTADIQVDSVNFTWMQVGGITFENDNPGGYATFIGIPVSALDTAIPVSAETTAMAPSVYVIDYTLTFASSSLPAGVITEDAAPVQEETTAAQEETTTVEETTTAAQSFIIKGEITEDGDKMTVVSANGKTYVIEKGKLFEVADNGDLVELTDNLENVNVFDSNNNKLSLENGKFVNKNASNSDDKTLTTTSDKGDSKSAAPVVIAIIIIAAAVVVCLVVVFIRKKNKLAGDNNQTAETSDNSDNNDAE